MKLLSRTWRNSVFLIIVLALVLLAAHQWHYFDALGRDAVDDAYISWRYAKNLVSGNGLVFNPGERVLATTAPLYALLLAAVGLAADDLPSASNVIGALAVAAQAALAARLLGKAAAPRMLTGAAALFLLGGGLGSYWYLGLETNLAAAQ